jgi:hypothetical protein
MLLLERSRDVVVEVAAVVRKMMKFLPGRG